MSDSSVRETDFLDNPGPVSRRLAMGVLLLSVWAVFGQTVRFDFISVDDPDYVYENPIVLAGLTWKSIGEAFLPTNYDLWFPLTRLSFMLDRELFGLAPSGFHFTNVLLHSINAVLLLWVLDRLTGSFWRAFAVAAMFAVHPLRVESVAWITERKDVLSGFFFLLLLGAYTRYVEKPAPSRMAPVLICLILGMLAKPILMVVPALLLLLDGWPLGRLRLAPTWREILAATRPLIREKLPLLVVVIPFACLAYIHQDPGEVRGQDSLLVRFSNVALAYAAYLRLTVWPTGLAFVYPYVTTPSPLAAAGAVLLTITVTTGVLLARRIAPLTVGWFWFLGGLVPVIGIVPFGPHAYADRFTYLPHIGLFIAIVWGLGATVRGRRRQIATSSVILAVIVVFGLLSHRRTTYWSDSETLYLQNLAVTRDNWFIHSNLGVVYLQKNALDTAAFHLGEAARINPSRKLDINQNFGILRLKQGDPRAAEPYFRVAVQIRPQSEALAHYLGLTLAMQGRTDEAVAWYERALVLSPGFAEAHINLGLALAAQKRSAEAIAHYAEALELDPTNASAHNNWGYLLLTEGRPREALPHFEEALRLVPEYAQAQQNLDQARAQVK